MREFSFDDEGITGTPTCCSWLLTDCNLFVIGFESSHVVLFDHTTGNIDQKCKLDETYSSPINCIAAHGLHPLITLGHESGLITIYDYS